MSLSAVAQDDFSGGIVRLAEGQRAPLNSAYDIVNGLLDEEAAVYRRGSSVYLSSAAQEAILGLTDGHLAAGRRTVLWGAVRFWVLDATEIPATISNTNRPKALRPGATLNGAMWFPKDGGGIVGYAGSRKVSNYTTGSVATTAGNRTVTGTGTAFLANVDAGMIFTTGAEGIVAAVVSDTELQLTTPAATTYSGAYTLAFHTTTLTGFSSALDSSISAVASVGERLVILAGNEAYFSERSRPTIWDSTNFHGLPSDATSLGGTGMRDNLVWFTTRGVWLVQGMDLDLTDDLGNPQHTLTQINKDMILWGDAGLAAWKGTVAVPALDDVYLLSLNEPPVSAPVALSAGIRPLYRSYVAAGHKPGMATVHRGHYFLPIVNSSSATVDTLICRLDGTDREGRVRPGWTRWSGHSGSCVAFATRMDASTAPKLIGATGTYVLDLDATMAPTSTNSEADGTTHALTVITRSFAATRSLKVLWKKLRARFDASASGAVVLCEYATGDDYATWTSLGSQTPAASGEVPVTWTVGKRAQSIAFRLSTTTQAARLTLRSLEAFFRPTGRQ